MINVIKKEIDYINQILYPEYKVINFTWEELTREEKSNLVMNYVDEIKLYETSNHECK